MADFADPLPQGTYQLQLSYTNPWGETFPSPILTLAVGVNQSILTSGGLPPSATGARMYYGLVGQPLNSFLTGNSSTFAIKGSSTFSALVGSPPTRATSFYPDSEGSFVSAYTIFRWLSEALTTASGICGGIPSTSGMQSISGQAMYLLPSTWEKVTSLWFDGFPIALAGRNDAFYRNKLPGISFLGILQEDADRTYLELQPQTNRTGGATVTSGGVGITASSIPCTDLSSFKLSLGLAQVGTEVVSYSAISGSNLTGVSRGLGGTTQSAWLANAPVTELNIRMGGNRIFTGQYAPGSSNQTLNVPPGWRRPLIDYLLNKAREGEQSPAEAKRKLEEFTNLLKGTMHANKQVFGPRQIGGPSAMGDGIPTSAGFRTFIS